MPSTRWGAGVFTSHGHRGRIRRVGAAAAVAVSVLGGAVLLAGPLGAGATSRPRATAGAAAPAPVWDRAAIVPQHPDRGKADQAAGPADRGNEDSVSSAPRPGPTSTAHRRFRRTPPTRTTLDRRVIRRPPPPSRQTLDGGTASATALVPVPVPVWVPARSELAGGLLAVPQRGREAQWAAQDGAGAECAAEAAGITAGAAMLSPGLRARRSRCLQPTCVAAAVAVTR